MLPTEASIVLRLRSLRPIAIFCTCLLGFFLEDSRAEEWTSGGYSPRQAAEGKSDGILRDLTSRYYDNAQLEAYLKGFVQRCGHMAALHSIGRSGDGTELWALEVSDVPGVAEAEPGFKYVGGVHGDEPLGRQLLLALAEHLCLHYGADDAVTALVRDVHLFLIPAMNPDGFARRHRGNAHGQDLNRDFPDQYRGGLQALPGHHQPETRAVMNFSLAHRTVASASLHEGALVANYPWDGTPDGSGYYAACPDDATFRVLAQTYARAHATMSASAEFAGGITNGAAWYPLWGGMQDWNYLVAGCMELTVEMCDTKWPPAATLAMQWQQHRPALIALAAHVAVAGVRGTVTSADRGGAPLAGATVSVMGIRHDVTAGSVFGDYYRLLAPGTYTLTASAPGHDPASTTVVVPTPLSGLTVTVVTSNGAHVVPAPAAPGVASTPAAGVQGAPRLPRVGTVVNFVLAPARHDATTGQTAGLVASQAWLAQQGAQGTGVHLMRGAASGPSPPRDHARRTRLKRAAPPQPLLAGAEAVYLAPTEGVGQLYLGLWKQFERQRMSEGGGAHGVVQPLGLAGHVVGRLQRPAMRDDGGGGSGGATDDASTQEGGRQGAPEGASADPGVDSDMADFRAGSTTAVGPVEASVQGSEDAALVTASGHQNTLLPQQSFKAAVFDSQLRGHEHELDSGASFAHGMLTWVAIGGVGVAFVALVASDKRLIHRRALLRTKRGASE